MTRKEKFFIVPVNYWEVPAYPSLMDIWQALIQDIKDDIEERNRLSEAKKTAPSYCKKRKAAYQAEYRRKKREEKTIVSAIALYFALNFSMSASTFSR